MVDEQPAQLEFLQFHLPGLLPGDYTVAVSQALSATGIDANNKFETQLAFSVAGERLLLKPIHIQAVFPPEGSQLDHANILPHLVLTRSTAPWERLAKPDDPESPWLALLLLEEGEEFTTSTVKLSKLIEQLPRFTPEPGEDPDAPVTLLELPVQGTAVQSLPTLAELKLLCHVRRSKDAAGIEGPEQAVIVGNRLPAKGVRSTVHLVSLENRYPNGTFDAGTGNSVSLVSLKSWSFTCLRTYLLQPAAAETLKSQNAAFKADADKLASLIEVEIDGQTAFLAQAGKLLGHDVPTEYRAALLKASERLITFRELVHALDVATLCLPTRNGVAENLLGAGFLPLPHQFRDGQQFVSWYHGPLTPAADPVAVAGPPVRAADALLRYHTNTGLLDVSYAAAWELGRLLGLSSKAFSVALYNWKRTVSQQHLVAEKALLHTSPLQLAAPAALAQAPATADVPPAVTKWFADTSLLVDVPFSYLVPDENLLPAESIRFFQVDAHWMDMLLDGAASLGRVIGQDLEHEQVLNDAFRFPYRAQGLSGVLIRSEIVAGWPDMVVQGYTSADDKTPQQPIRRAALSKNVLLCLFTGSIQMLDIQLKPEALHFGLDDPESKEEGVFVKLLRQVDGSTDKAIVDPIPWRNPSQQVLDIASLVTKIQTAQARPTSLNSADFALEMIAGSPKIRFSITPSPARTRKSVRRAK
ncbi:hypothetical protein ACFST9_12600 [Hymenobacter monticola]|uniref:Uncharacterized protein n=1 Tax=Hymenobacter monticola TaxID=1705399 RepID=A0ABY4B733_9BACT|nr:hypothetical protein [Hymenobacter monticola]UOE34973.1 hypothetical protein MTP16_04810 [Hymenobacter monticola]